MRIDIATLFPEMCDFVLSESIVGRARKAGLVEICCTNIRDFADNKHNRVDDKPYGGGTGMVMQAEPIFSCVQSLLESHKTKPRIIYMSPQGKTLTQEKVKELSRESGLILICGHYEGVDQRVWTSLRLRKFQSEIMSSQAVKSLQWRLPTQSYGFCPTYFRMRRHTALKAIMTAF